MKRIIPLLVFMLFVAATKGQDLRKLEFGSTLITINSFKTNYYSVPDRQHIEYSNGLFFRYNRKRLAFRSQLSFSDNSIMYASPEGRADGISGDIRNKDFRVGIGGQFCFLKKVKGLYGYVDAVYRYLLSTGHNYGGIWGVSEKFSETSNSIDTFFGAGFKLGFLKVVYLSPEIGFLVTNKFAKQVTTSLRTGEISKHDYTNTGLKPNIKLILTVKF